MRAGTEHGMKTGIDGGLKARNKVVMVPGKEARIKNNFFLH